MSRQRLIVVPVHDREGRYIRTDFIPADEYCRGATEGGPVVVRDCEPFLSMADGKTIINSRSQYRAHLKAHGCVEVGSGPMPERKPVEMPPVAPVLRDIWNNRHNPDALRNIRESGKIR